jgi:predicted glycosyltransferase
MNIWLDLANSPQVLFFRPILDDLHQRGHNVKVSIRDYAQTVALTNEYNIQHEVIGKHGGKSLFRLATELGHRALQLSQWANSQNFDLAVSHNSYAQIIAAKLLRIPVVTLMDYEHQPLNHLAFRLANKVLVPKVFPKPALRKSGAINKTVFYPGLKEQVYLDDFVPITDFRAKEGFPDDQSLIIVRPPASWTAYHRFENQIFDFMLDELTNQENVTILFLPRLRIQAHSLANINKRNLKIANKTYNGPNLLYSADMVVSGGGTMNREAAILGTKAYSVFKGKNCAVDDFLINQGRLIRIQNEDDINTKMVSNELEKFPILKKANLKTFLVEQILS